MNHHNIYIWIFYIILKIHIFKKMAYYDESESMRSNIKIADQNMKK